MAFADASLIERASPVDLMENVAESYDWSYERGSDDELTLVVAGSWADYQVSLNWRDDLETLHLACAFDFRIPENRLNEVHRLIAAINEQLWVGHFDVWTGEGLVMFRHGMLLHGAEATPAQCEALLKAALEASERYYKAFQFVVWAGRDTKTALAGVMFETAGSA
jgi:hypothetical protein